MKDRVISQITEHQLASERDLYERQLSDLESRFHIDLSASRAVPIEHVLEVRLLGHMFAAWMGERGIKTDDEIQSLHTRVDNFMVLTEDDKRSLLMAQLGEAIAELQNVKDDFVSKGLWEQVSPEEIVYFNDLMESHGSNLQLLASGEVNCATKFGYSNSEGNKFSTVIFVDWSDEKDPFSHCSLEGSVAEETFHLGANTIKLASQYLDLGHQFFHHTEELAVKYYVVEAMRDLGISEDKVKLYISMDPYCLPVWKGFIDDRGRSVADGIFFYGQGTPEDIESLLMHRRNEFLTE